MFTSCLVLSLPAVPKSNRTLALGPFLRRAETSARSVEKGFPITAQSALTQMGKPFKVSMYAVASTEMYVGFSADVRHRTELHVHIDCDV